MHADLWAVVASEPLYSGGKDAKGPDKLESIVPVQQRQASKANATRGSNSDNGVPAAQQAKAAGKRDRRCLRLMQEPLALQQCQPPKVAR